MRNNIAAIRKQKNMSQKELAEKLGIQAPNLNQIEKGAAGISLKRAKEIAKKLECGLDDLFFTKVVSYFDPDEEGRFHTRRGG